MSWASSAAAFLAFDILQLAALCLTGGLEDPFSFLLLAPVAVSATILTNTPAPSPYASIDSMHHNSGHLAFSVALDRRGFSYLEHTFWVDRAGDRYPFRNLHVAGGRGSPPDVSALAAGQLALAREQQLAALGGLAAAAAHELRVLPETIAVASGEIARELNPDSPMYDDVQLLISETGRCRDILAELSDRSEEGDDTVSPFVLPVHALVQAAALRHEAENVAFDLRCRRTVGGSRRRAGRRAKPEIIHGLGTIIQNAADCFRHQVEINTQWDREFIRVHIRDDGPGFAAGLLERLGEPYISSRKRSTGHMGLGIFIARTLLLTVRGVIAFRNDPEGGAAVDIVWRRDTLENRDVGPQDNMNAIEQFEDRTLLIVDDDEPFLGRLARAMEAGLRCRDRRVGA